MHQQLLTEIGERLYGPRWPLELARDICVSEGTIKRWAAGTDEVDDAAWRNMALLLETRAIDLQELRNRIKDRLPHPRG